MYYYHFVLFYSDPSIFIKGQKGFEIAISPHEGSASFIVCVYTTSKVRLFDVVNEDLDNLYSISVILLTYPVFEVVASYRVEIHEVDEEIRNYTIHVVNEDNRSVTQSIRVFKARGKYQKTFIVPALVLYTHLKV